MWYHGLAMMTSTFDPTLLNALLARMVQQAAWLETALEQETAALSERELEALNQAVAHKLHIAESLEQLTQEQNALLAAAGFSPDAAGMQAYLHVCDSHAQLRSQWEQLQTVMQRCQQLNQVNGGALHLQQQQVQTALQMLRGADPDTELYDPRGQAIASGASQRISSKA